MQILRFVARKIPNLLLVLFLVSVFAFLLLQMVPRDPVDLIAPLATPEDKELLREDLGLNDPLVTQYVNWLGDALHGDLGSSYVKNATVTDLLAQRLPTTIQLLVYAQVIALVIAIPLGILTAHRANTKFDRVASGSMFGFLALPNFVLGVLLVWLLAGGVFSIFPATFPADQSLVDRLRSLFLPALVLALPQVAVYGRLLRTDMIATLQEDFIGMAKAKGMPTRRVLLRHAFRPSSLTLLTVVGLNVGALIGGALVVELLFNLDGIGSVLIEAVLSGDLKVVQGFVLVIATGYVAINFFVDILYGVLDPRIRHAR